MKTKYIIALAAGALALAGCQREELAEPGVLPGKDGVVTFAPSVSGIDSEFKSGASESGKRSLTLTSKDGSFSLPMSCSASTFEGGALTTKATLINEEGGITADEFATAIDSTFWVAAWNDAETPAQIIPDKELPGYTTADVKYQMVRYRAKDVTGASLATPYWMTMQPMRELNEGVTAIGPADDEYIWKKAEKKTFYAYANVPEDATMDLLASAGGQTMTCTGIPGTDVLMGYYTGNGSTGSPATQTGTASIQFHHPLAAVKVTTGTLAAGVTISSVAIEKVYGAGELKVKHVVDKFTWTRGDGTVFTDGNLVDEIGIECDGEASFVIPQTLPSKARIRVTLEEDGVPFNVFSPLSGITWKADTVYTYTIGYNPQPEELLPGKFSISSDKYVQFSRGNLYCTDKGDGKYEFGFERNQYDCRSRNGYKSDQAMIDGEVTITPVNTSGLFQWNCVNGVISPDYGAFTKKATADLEGNAADRLEFGNSIDDPFDWFTLGSSEWNYILKERPNYANLYKLGVEVNGMNGMILAPDDYSGTISDKYSSETTPTWAEAETAGLVFLPYAGMWEKEATSSPINYWNTGSRYWCVDTEDKTKAHRVRFETGYDTDVAVGEAGRQNGLSVRLVQKFPKPDEEFKFIDLGLPSGTFWANMNIGARSVKDEPTCYGDYYAWSKIETYYEPVSSNPPVSVVWKEAYSKGYVQDYGFPYTKYDNKDGLKKLELTDDVANVVLGEGAQIPSVAQWNELLANCNITKTNNKGYGYVTLTSKVNGQSIILPAGGFYSGKDNTNYGNFGVYYMTSELSTSDLSQVYTLWCGATEDLECRLTSRFTGFPVRAVKEKTTYPGWVDLGIESDNGKQLLWSEYDVIGIDAEGIATLASDNDSYHSTMFTWTQAASIIGVASMPEGVSGTLRLPSYTEIGELKKASTGSTFKWINSGVKGGKITLNGQTIFYPANGYYSGSLQDQGVSARYWCGTEDVHGKLIITLLAVGHNQDVTDTDGHSVRLVIEVSSAD